MPRAYHVFRLGLGDHVTGTWTVTVRNRPRQWLAYAGLFRLIPVGTSLRMRGQVISRRHSECLTWHIPAGQRDGGNDGYYYAVTRMDADGTIAAHDD